MREARSAQTPRVGRLLPTLLRRRSWVDLRACPCRSPVALPPPQVATALPTPLNPVACQGDCHGNCLHPHTHTTPSIQGWCAPWCAGVPGRRGCGDATYGRWTPATSPKSVRTRRGRAAMDVCIDEMSARSSTSLYNAHGGYRANVSEMQMAERPRRGEVAWARRIECKSHLASSIGALTLQVAWSSISCV
jgi:hypothetical protein